MSATYEHLKRCAARFAWERRDGICPQPVEGRRITWAEWWGRKFGDGETLAEYRERVRQASGEGSDERTTEVRSGR